MYLSTAESIPFKQPFLLDIVLNNKNMFILKKNSGLNVKETKIKNKRLLKDANLDVYTIASRLNSNIYADQ